MNDGLWAAQYALTDEVDMLGLDAIRRQAEADPEQADWLDLAGRYEAQGRPAMAEKCRGRAKYYQVAAVMYA